MFYNGDLKNGANVRKTDFRPLYLTGANTRIESNIETFSDGSDGSDGEWREREEREDGEEREEGEDEEEEEEEDGEEREEDKVDSSALLVEAKSSSSASSFLSSLSSMYTAGSKSKNTNKESVKPVKSNRNEIIKSSNGRDRNKERNSTSSSAEISEDEVTLKPLIFFDLLTSEDSSGTGTGTGTGSGIGSGTDNSHSHSNIGDSDHSYCTSIALIASLLSHCNSSLSL